MFQTSRLHKVEMKQTHFSPYVRSLQRPNKHISIRITSKRETLKRALFSGTSTYVQVDDDATSLVNTDAAPQTGYCLSTACTLEGEYLLGGMPFVDRIDLLGVEGVAPEEPRELVAMFCLSTAGVGSCNAGVAGLSVGKTCCPGSGSIVRKFCRVLEVLYCGVFLS